MTDFPMNWAYANGEPNAFGVLRSTPQDFLVDEDLGFEPAGEGEHVYLLIRKTGENTAWIGKQLAQLAQVNKHDVSYAGLKDRHAVTRQWFSVYLPGSRQPSWSLLNSDTVQVETVSRHLRKLRRGDHRANRFVITVRDLEGVDEQDIRVRCDAVRGQGVPNYFGPQRFGREGNNLREADDHLLRGVKIRNRQTRGLILSAARSYLFNEVLSSRVQQGSWQTLMAGEDAVEKVTGPMWGRGRLAGSAERVAFESDVLQPHRAWCDALEHVGLKQERRSLVCQPQDFQCEWGEDGLQFSFALSPGGFATSVLREVLKWKEMPGG